jgi:hypothetical protein
MAFTCGPHHLVHGIHLAAEGRPGGALDLFVVLVGFPAGVVWFLLRVEAFRGGRGDRFVAGNPAWVLALPTLAGVYLTVVVAGAVASGSPHADNLLTAAPNVLLVVVYSAIGYFLVRTQIRNRGPLGGWSISGLALGIVFPTCAVMHAVFAFYTATGRYGYDVHGFAVDWLAVPAGLYFLWVVQRLYADSLEDWNRATPDVMQSRAVVS